MFYWLSGAPDMIAALVGAAPYLLFLVVGLRLCVRWNARNPFAYSLAGSGLAVAILNVIAFRVWAMGIGERWPEPLLGFVLSILDAVPLVLLIMAMMDVSPEETIDERPAAPDNGSQLFGGRWPLIWLAAAAIVYASALQVAEEQTSSSSIVAGFGPFLLAVFTGAGYFVRHRNWYPRSWQLTMAATMLAGLAGFVRLWLAEWTEDVARQHFDDYREEYWVLGGFMMSLCDAVPIGLLFWALLRSAPPGVSTDRTAVSSERRTASISEQRRLDTDVADRVLPRAVAFIGWGLLGLLVGVLTAFGLLFAYTTFMAPQSSGGGGMGGAMHGMQIAHIFFVYLLPPCVLLGGIAGVVVAVRRIRGKPAEVVFRLDGTNPPSDS